MLKKMLMCFCLFAYMLGVSAGTDGVVEDNKKGDVAVKNLTRAMTLLDNTIDKCFKGSDLHMCDLYHLGNGRVALHSCHGSGEWCDGGSSDFKRQLS